MTKIFNIIISFQPSMSTANFDRLSIIVPDFLRSKATLQKCSENFVNFPQKQHGGVPD